MRTMNFKKYKPFKGPAIINRKWPDNIIGKAPTWCSVDLRDGNQALSIPMNLQEKLEMFKLLTTIGFKEIEIGFPSASEVEFQFARKIIEDKLIPSGVAVQVLTQAREHLIRKTLEAVDGAEEAIIHLYNSTSTVQRKVVFNKSRKEIIDIAVEGAKLLKRLKDESGNQGIRFEYSPESFTGTEIDFAVEISEAVLDSLGADRENPVILNLPATVEMSTPNIYADQIESFINQLKDPERAIISLHTHNDRGCAIAAGELGLMAGATRVEGTLFGNGERTGNMDIITMALNIFSQGVDPELDFTDLNRVREIYCRTTRMTVHDRHPYAGDLVYTAFSGSHQDAINKGMKAHKNGDVKCWEVPYLPIDPEDVGRSYESIIRINSQSGKGGVAYIMEMDFGFMMPKDMQPEFGKSVQKETDKSGRELKPLEIKEIFEKEYLLNNSPFSLVKCSINMDSDSLPDGVHAETTVKVKLMKDSREISFEANGNGPVDAFVSGFIKLTDFPISIENYSEHAIERGASSLAASYIKVSAEGQGSTYGVGIDENISIASMKAVLSAVNRLF